MSIERYRFSPDILKVRTVNPTVIMEPAKNGGWVQYDEHHALVRQLEDELEAHGESNLHNPVGHPVDPRIAQLQAENNALREKLRIATACPINVLTDPRVEQLVAAFERDQERLSYENIILREKLAALVEALEYIMEVGTAWPGSTAYQKAEKALARARQP